MVTRLLAPEEWSRLEGTPLGEVWRTLPTSGITVLIVEDDDGAVVAHWTFFQCMHAENVWVAPTHRRKGAVARSLLSGMRRIAATLRTKAFITASENAEVTALITGLGGTRLPGDSYSVPVERSV